MPFTAPYTLTATFAKPLLGQVVALIQRDQAAAIAIVNTALSPINEFHFGPGARTAMPWLSLSIEGENFDRLDDMNYRAGWVPIRLDLDVGQFDTELAQLNAHDYARILDMILSNAGPWTALADWTTALPINDISFDPTVLTVTQVAVGATAIYSYSSYTGTAPRVGMNFTFSGFSNAGNNGLKTVTAVGTGTVTAALGSQMNETHAAIATTAGYTMPPQEGTVKEVVITNHRFTAAQRHESAGPILVVTLNLAIRLIEG